MNHHHQTRPPAFSLVVSLIILTLLSVLVVSFLSSTALDRTTARAFLGKSQAEIAADTAVKQAISMLREHITQYPDSVTYWESLDAPSVNGTIPAEGTMLYFNDQPMPTGYDTKTPTPPKRYILPLMSRGVDANTGQLLGPVQIDQKKSLFNSEPWMESQSKDSNGRIVASTAVDLNQARFNGDTAGWIGSPSSPTGSTSSSPRPYRVKWIELKENGNVNGKTLGRYAFWVEDESFKVNVNYAGSIAGGRGKETTENNRINFSDPTAKPLPPQFAALLPLQGLLQSAHAPAAIDRDAAAASMTTMRGLFLLGQAPDLQSFNQVTLGAASSPYKVADEAKFLATALSGGLNLSRHGSQRLNLNGLGFEKRYDDKSVLSDKELQDGIDRLVAAQRYHVPKFPERFFRTSATTNAAVLNAEQVKSRQTSKGIKYYDIYSYKVAANIRDYIDPDVLPTIIMENGVVATRQAAITALPSREGPDYSDLWAQGKDSAPFLQEAVARYRSSVNLAAKRYTLKTDYYFEFWNMTDFDITADQLGSSPLLKVVNQVGWVENSTGTSLQVDSGIRPLHNKLRATILNLKTGVYRNGAPEKGGVRFAARTCTVITSDPDYMTVPPQSGKSPGYSGGYNLSNIYYCSEDGDGKAPTRQFAGPLPSGTINGIRPQFVSQIGGQTPQDYETEVLLSNDTGIIESQPASLSHGGYEPVTGTLPSSPSALDKKRDFANPRDDWYGGSLVGNNNSVSQLSDPRTNCEAIVFTRYNGGISEPDQGRYFNDTDTPRFSLGYQNTRYGSPHTNNRWPDYYHGWDNTASNTNKVEISQNCPGPAYVANAPLTSIGQLGDIFDPARVQGSVGSLEVEGARGGGRTFKIGQQDDRIDHASINPASLSWASWRLCDFLSTSSDLFLPGLININGLNRDNGAALRASLYGMTLQSVTRTPQDGSSTLRNGYANFDTDEATDKSKPGFNYLINQAIQRYTTNGPFYERGEISELAAFNIGSGLIPTVDSNGKTLAGTAQDMSQAFDRTREEVVRRLLEISTTRGSIFSVYAIGQSIIDGPRGKIVTGTHRMKVTFALLPKLNSKRPDLSDFRVTAENFEPKNTSPSDPKSIQARFAKPDQYDIKILQVSF